MVEKQYAAKADELSRVQEDIKSFLQEAECPPKALMQVLLAVEEIFINIVNYAYGDKKGAVTLKLELLNEPDRYALWFCDTGVPFDPTARKEPDLSEDLLDREIGGLGIFLVRKTMDKMTYKREDGWNITCIEKLK